GAKCRIYRTFCSCRRSVKPVPLRRIHQTNLGLCAVAGPTTGQGTMATTVARPIDISGALGQRLPRLLLRQVALVTLSMLLLFGVGHARAGEASTPVPAWSVTQLSGSAFIRSAADANAAWRPLRAGAVVVPGSVVMTAEDAHLVLGNGIDRVRLSGNSQVELPAA